MANHVSYFPRFFIILVLVAAVGNMRLIQVDGSDTCAQEGLGTCSQLGDCDKKCRALHKDGQGSCDPQFNLCTCYYNCPSTPSPPSPPNHCTIGLGLCNTECNEDCCKGKCAKQYKQGAGYCDSFVGYYLCNCDYIC